MSGGSSAIAVAQSTARVYGTLGWCVRIDGVPYARSDGVEVLEVGDAIREAGKRRVVLLRAVTSDGAVVLSGATQRGGEMLEVGWTARLDDDSQKFVRWMKGAVSESQVRLTSDRRRWLYEVQLSDDAAETNGSELASIVRLETVDVNSGYGMMVERIDSPSPVGRGAVRVVQRVERVKESVFDLVPGWLADGRDGEATSEYNRSTSSDFASVADVFRVWVLNEDGFYSESAYGSPATFDVREFFDDPMEMSEPRAFAGLASAGSSWTDGATRTRLMYRLSDLEAWQDWDVAYVLMSDRAGVVITGEMDSGVIDAAQAGTLSVRIEAGLPAVRRHERFRVVGNALTNSGVVRGEVLSPVIRSVNGGSNAVDAAIENALSEGVARVRADSSSSSVKVRVFPVDPSLSSGMRIVRVVGDGWDSALPDAVAGCSSLRVRSVRHLLGEAQVTEVEVAGEVGG